MLKRIDRKWLGIGLAIATLVLLTVVLAPAGDRQLSGSTFNRAPDGYGAWYAYMEQRGTSIQRWKRPPLDLMKSPKAATQATLLKVKPRDLDAELSRQGKEWLEKGNTLVILGWDAPATRARFRSSLNSPAGRVTIETTRRRDLGSSETALLQDDEGAIVWQQSFGKGRIIYAVTPFLGANAYQKEPGNFAFLERLVKQQGNTVWVDEYLHGYKESEVAQKEGAKDWLSYLLRTPLAVMLVQMVMVVVLMVLANNRRFGLPTPLPDPKKNNSSAYIGALAGVLHKAGRSEFVLDLVGRQEQREVQRALGFGDRPVDEETLTRAWTAQTGQSAAVLKPLLMQTRSMPEADLKTWLSQIQAIRQHLPKV